MCAGWYYGEMKGRIEAEVLKSLYSRRKFSAREISIHLGHSQSKINYWLARYRIAKRSISESMYNKHNPNGDPFELPRLQYHSLVFLAGLGLGLYWGEGNKKNPTSVRLGNTDPRLIKTFIQFLISIFKIKPFKLRFGLQIFSDMSPKEGLLFWASELSKFGVTHKQFQKVVVTPARSIGTYREKTRHGVLTVYYSNVKLKRFIDRALAEFKI